jgi:6-pyruvoyltetrahydropterin/6-carboxytetrahydropterin synthase
MNGTVRMTRRVTFSSGHRYWLNELSDEQNRELFGPWASRFNHGHNYVLDVSVDGQVDPSTGMVVNIKRVDDALKAHILSQFDQKSINDEIPAFASRSSSLENLITYISETLSVPGVLPEGASLAGLRLEEMPRLYAELDLQNPISMITLTRTYEFAASHRLHSPMLSDAENIELFGKCNNRAGHGHNYLLEVAVTGQPDPRTGMLADIGEVDRVVNELVVDRYDHKNLNEDIPEFEGRTTTSEVVAIEIFNRLKDHLPAKLHRVRLHETARNIFEVTG